MKTLNLTDDQYDIIVTHLAMGHTTKNMNTIKDRALKDLPKELYKDVKRYRDIINYGNYTKNAMLSSAKTADDLFKMLLILESVKEGEKGAEMALDAFCKAKDKTIIEDLRDGVFSNGIPKYKFAGTKYKNIVGTALANNKITSDIMFTLYINTALGSYYGTDSSIIAVTMIDNDPELSKDIHFLTRLGNSKNRTLAVKAVGIADKKILPYLVDISNKWARKALEERMNQEAVK